MGVLKVELLMLLLLLAARESSLKDVVADINMFIFRDEVIDVSDAIRPKGWLLTRLSLGFTAQVDPELAATSFGLLLL